MWVFGSRRFFLWRGVTDMRKSFNGLSAIVRNEMGGQLMSGDIFIFANRRRDRIKLLLWDRTGFVIWYKRLEQGTFEIPQSGTGEVSEAQLVLILEGIELGSVRHRKRYIHH
ncbi:MAG: IS66 family insertion sequence element accessory protein TnpB [Bacteroidia bacterium]|nr:IS66 family insertion sequence element accessory protein TnpB [Bacteroidia bacterium]MCB9231996.1 IS66 family insertion sequence element accessory protein TnpB [Bacteroidia bacterium]MCB9234123.1 IS66 family insertion sequence element accessory protein TnpB [Bacteroidia bacterium]MCB9236213.1 IS66 family insertion sequence element accessory protein TnpB [Bacteroidia bacterium]